MVDETIGNANTKNSSYGSVGAFNGLFPQDVANQAMAMANELYPQLPEADPWEAAFQFFTEMGRQSSQPGATLLGSAVGSMQAPMDYLNAKKKEKAESDRARMQATLSLGTTLKGKDSKGYINVNVDGKPTVMTPTEITAAKAAGKMVVPYEKPTSGGSAKANTQLSKLYDDFDIAQIQANKNANKFLLDNPQATPEEIFAASEADSSAQEAKTLSNQIETVAQAAGFNKEIFSAERDIRKEWNNFKIPFNKIQIGYQKLVKSLESVSGPGDMAAVFGFMKLLDPGSVVRESEFSAAQNTSGLMDRIYLQKSKLVEGELLTPKQRDEFMKLATEFYNLTSVQFGDARLDLGQVVKNNSVFKVENIFGSEEGPPSWYLDSQNYSDANDLGITAEALWLQLTPAEQAAWIEANGDS